MIALVLAMALAGEPLGTDSLACVNGEPSILVHVTGLKDRTGRLKLELYPDTADDFLKDDRDLIAAGKTFRRVWAPMPASGPVDICIKTPGAGRYALFFTHDRDGKNKFDIWKDGAGVPSNRKLGRSKPQVADATVDVGTGVTTVNIRVQYLRGLSGFAPVKPD
ncbi:MAG: DUF2141 domain-containing protein [Sphingomonas sp.]